MATFRYVIHDKYKMQRENKSEYMSVCVYVRVRVLWYIWQSWTFGMLFYIWTREGKKRKEKTRGERERERERRTAVEGD